jgi:nucleoside permease NupC
MKLNYLSYIFYAIGIIPILYFILALLSLMDHIELQKKLLSCNYDLGNDLQRKKGSIAAEAFVERAKILLRNGQFDAARADCKRAMAISPDHAEAKRLINYILPS